MSLFQLGDFTLASGTKSAWKIECDALTPDDWAALAEMAVERLPSFSWVEGVPRGGLPFAAALKPYIREAGPLLICEDVVTTGGSMSRFRDTKVGASYVIGVTVFARGVCPNWVTPLFQMS